MKKWFCILILCLFATPAAAFDINAGVSGSWFNEGRPGHGFAIEYTEAPGACEQVEGQGCLVVYWFVYDKEGNPIFLLGVLPVDGNVAEGELFYFTGLQFGSFMPEPDALSWGTLKLRFTDCNSGFANYESGFMPPDGAQFNADGNFRIARLAFVSDLDCRAANRIATMPKTEAAGYYVGRAFSRDFGNSDAIENRTVAAIIRESGEALMLWPGRTGFSLFRGGLTGDGLALDGQLDALASFPGELPDESTQGSVQVRTGTAATLDVINSEGRPGNGNPADFLEGHWSGLGQEGDFVLGFKPDSNRPADMSRISRCWSIGVNGVLTVLPTRIAANGEFSFELSTDSGGTCQVSGQVQPGGEGWNAFDAQAELTGCDFAGTYDGTMLVGEISGAAAGNDSLLFFLMDNGTRALIGQGQGLNPSQCES